MIKLNQKLKANKTMNKQIICCFKRVTKYKIQWTNLAFGTQIMSS